VGTTGIVSAIAFSPDTSAGMFAVGTFKGGRISCYSEDTGDERLLELELETGGAKVDGQGYTQVGANGGNPLSTELDLIFFPSFAFSSLSILLTLMFSSPLPVNRTTSASMIFVTPRMDRTCISIGRA
jgi:hypothetical protein